MQPILIVAGMHRSGTSLTTSLLQSAGVNIGSKLIEAGNGNTQGHFEDAEFVQFHEQVLESQGVSHEGWTLDDDFFVEQTYVQQAKALVDQKRSGEQIVAWKDPRTTLFLEFWQKIIPDAKFILIYRSPWEVVDSLYRRGDEIFQQRPELAIEIWFNYNLKILNFRERHRRQTILFDINQIIADCQILVDTIQQQWQLNLSQPENLYQASLFKQEKQDSYRAKLIKQYYGGAYNLYQKLHQAQTHRSKQVGVKLDSDARQYIFYDWQAQSQAQTEIQQLQKQLQTKTVQEAETEQLKVEIQKQIEQYENQIEQLKQQINSIQNENHQLQEKVSQQQSEVEQLQHQLSQQQSEMKQLQHQLEASQNEIKQLETAVAEMENSKFWQLRNKYHQLKQQLKINKPQ